MATNYIVPEVTAELIADVSKTLAYSTTPMSLTDLANCYESGQEYVRRAAVASVQLGLTRSIAQARNTALYTCNEEKRDVLKRASKEEVKIAFRSGLQNYGPFLLFADYVNKGFSPIVSANRTRGLFHIASSAPLVEKQFKAWGKYADLIEEGTQGLRLKVNEQNFLPAAMVKKLLEALEADLPSKLFAIDMLTPEVFSFLDTKGIKLDELAKALRNYESDPKPSAGRSLELYEAFIHAIATERKIDLTGTKDLSGWIDKLRGNDDLSANLLNFCKGMAALRNMTHHNPDAETHKEWRISGQGALASTLFVPISIKAVYLYTMERKQEL